MFPYDNSVTPVSLDCYHCKCNSQNLMNDILFDKGQICVNVINFLGGTLEINIFEPIVRCDNMLPHAMIKAIEKGKCLIKCLTAAQTQWC